MSRDLITTSSNSTKWQDATSIMRDMGKLADEFRKNQEKASKEFIAWREIFEQPLPMLLEPPEPPKEPISFTRHLDFGMPVLPPRYVMCRPVMEESSMTEREWMSSADPSAMLIFIQKRATKQQMEYAWAALMPAIMHMPLADWHLLPKDIAQSSAAAIRDIFGNPFRPVCWRDVTLTHPASVWKPFVEAADDGTAIVLHESLRDWNNGAIRHIAQAIYDDRRFEDMPILADALEEAGCAEPVILDHCRASGLHVRGCWLVDLILGKV